MALLPTIFMAHSGHAATTPLRAGATAVKDLPVVSHIMNCCFGALALFALAAANASLRMLSSS